MIQIHEYVSFNHFTSLLSVDSIRSYCLFAFSQAELVLQRYTSGRARDAVDFGEGWADADQAVPELAQRMRLPRGRHGAWTERMPLQQLVCTVLNGMAANSEQRRRPAVNARSRLGQCACIGTHRVSRHRADPSI